MNDLSCPFKTTKVVDERDMDKYGNYFDRHKKFRYVPDSFSEFYKTFSEILIQNIQLVEKIVLASLFLNKNQIPDEFDKKIR